MLLVFVYVTYTEATLLVELVWNNELKGFFLVNSCVSLVPTCLVLFLIFITYP